MHIQVHSTSQMVGTLKEELERRLKDVMQLREERDALQVLVLLLLLLLLCCMVRHPFAY